MNDKEIKERVSVIHSSIKTLKEELVEIEKECKHINYSVNYFSSRPGAVDIVKICDVCNKNLGFPPKNEVDDFLNKQKI